MNDKITKLAKRKSRVRSRMSEEGFRLSVSRSNKHFFAQITEVKTGKTILGLSDKAVLAEEKEKLNKTDKARVLGEKLGADAVAKGIKTVVFDRSGYLYHGRVKAFAEGARKAGLNF